MTKFDEVNLDDILNMLRERVAKHRSTINISSRYVEIDVGFNMWITMERLELVTIGIW